MNGPKVLAVSIVSARYCPQSESDDLCACHIQRSHSDIVKFSRNDDEYEKVRCVLRDMARDTISTKGRYHDMRNEIAGFSPRTTRDLAANSCVPSQCDSG